MAEMGLSAAAMRRYHIFETQGYYIYIYIYDVFFLILPGDSRDIHTLYTDNQLVAQTISANYVR